MPRPLGRGIRHVPTFLGVCGTDAAPYARAVETPVLEIDLLGRVAARIDGAEASLRGELPRALLARLALSAGEQVPGDVLVRDLWETPPDTAGVSVRGNISKLRAAGLDPYLHGGRGGYRLEVDADHVDLLRLRRDVRALRASAGAGGETRDLDGVAALLWSGVAMPELEEQPFAVRTRLELAEERRFAGQEVVAALLTRGDHQRALAGAGMLRAEHPLAEEPARLEATALAAVGRTSEALALIDAFRVRLADERGLELPPVLAELRLQVLRADSRVVAPADSRRVERHGIPLPLTPLVGRSRLLDDLVEARGRARLVTLTGPGGVGKSRLAVESARRSDLDDEQWMVDLAALPVGGDVTGAIAAAVGAIETTIPAITQLLDDRRALLVVDNAEHVLQSTGAAVRALLEGCQGLCVLVTSREPLRIPGEKIVPVTPLIGAESGDAVDLFAARAADARLGFEVDDRNRDAVERLCAALDGMPLALELAAARLDVMELDALAGSLLDHAVGDAGGVASVDAAGRHSSLAGAIAWSVALLTPTELPLLSQLARFAGTFDFEDIGAVCRVERADALATAVRLAQRSLLAVVEREGHPRRYRVLESVKAYLLARHPLGEADAADWDARHSAWYAEIADRSDPLLRTHQKPAARDLLDQAAPDLHKAYEHAVAHGDRTLAMRIAGGQAEHWMRKGTLAQGKDALSRAIAMAGDTPPDIESRVCAGAALLTYQLGGFDEAMGYADRGFAAAAECGDIDRQVLLLGYAAYGRSLFGDVETAEALMAQASDGMPGATAWVQASALLCIGQTLRALGRPAQALEALHRSRSIALRIGYAWMATSATYVTGKVLVDVRRGQDAIDMLLPGVAFALADEDPTSALALLHLVGGATALVERHADGAAIFAAVDRIGTRYGYNPVVAEGDDARSHRERVRIALTTAEQAQAAARGAEYDLDTLFAFASRLGRPASRRPASRRPASAENKGLQRVGA